MMSYIAEVSREIYLSDGQPPVASEALLDLVRGRLSGKKAATVADLLHKRGIAIPAE